MRWFASTALSMSLISGVTVAAFADSADDVQQGSAAAATLGTNMRAYTGSGRALSNNLVIPLTAATQITTADGQTTFTTNGFQSSGKPLIQITLNPNPATGDLSSIILQQDLTASGTLDYAQTFPMSGDATGQAISGICQNGYIQCSPGFTNCRFRAWTYGSNGTVTATTASGGAAGTPGSVGSLSGCFCFNNHCTGQNSTLLQLGVIGSDVGSGIISAFLAANTGMAISSASSGSNAAGSVVLTYYGYKPSTVSNGNNTTNMTAAQIAAMPLLSPADTQTPQTYYSDSATLNNAADNALNVQKSTPNSLYNIVTNAALSQVGTSVTCVNSVQPTLSSVTLSQSDSGTTNLSIDHSFAWSFKQSELDTFVFTGVDNKGLAMPEITYKFQPSTMLGGYTLQSVSLVGGWSPGGGCNGLSLSPVWTPSIAIGTPIAGNSINGICPNGGYQSPVMDWTFTAQYVTQEESVVTNTGCALYESDPNCTLQQDIWDGRPVIVNGMPMHNQQLGQSCKVMTGVGSLPAVTTCKPWFVQNRTFYCKNTATVYDFSTIKSNVATIENSTTMPTSSSFRYTDPTQGGATMTYGTITATPLPDCNQVCETKVPLPQTGVLYTNIAQSTVQTSTAKTTAQFLFYFKDCIQANSGSWSCPVDNAQGEIVVTQCGCSSDMGRALGALNAAGSSAQDAICSK